jgi:DNA repair photolyase
MKMNTSQERSKVGAVPVKVAWPPEPAHMISNFAGTGIEIFQELYGSLSQDPHNPFSRISVANSSFSLDPFVGCPARCAYCVVSSSARDLVHTVGSNGLRFKAPSQPRQLFAGADLVHALVTHPGFIPGKSVISIGTGSTESFLPSTHEATWDIMQALVRLRLRNPIWIVTKMGMTPQILETWIGRAKEIARHQIPLIISISYSALPVQIEPYEGDRFENLCRLRGLGVFISHHLRPIIRNVNDSGKSIAKALSASQGRVDAICIGGLRPDPGIQLLWDRSYRLDSEVLPKTLGKDLPEQVRSIVCEFVLRRDPTLPIMDRSSAVIAHFLGRSDYNLYKYRPDDDKTFLSVPIESQQLLQKKHGLTLYEIVTSHAANLKIPIIATTMGSDIRLGRLLSYQEHRLLLHSIGHSGLLDLDALSQSD